MRTLIAIVALVGLPSCSLVFGGIGLGISEPTTKTHRVLVARESYEVCATRRGEAFHFASQATNPTEGAGRLNAVPVCSHDLVTTAHITKVTDNRNRDAGYPALAGLVIDVLVAWFLLTSPMHAPGS